MGLSPTAIKAGQSGGLSLHRSFLAPGQHPPELQCLRQPTAPGKLSAGTQHWLPTEQLPEDSWFSPGELLRPFRLYNMVEEQLKWLTTHFPDTVLPRDLLRTHLTEVISPAMLDEQSSCLGNRLAACTSHQQSLFFSCCGSAGHKVAMTVLERDTATFQCRQQLSVDTGRPIYQISLSSIIPCDNTTDSTDAGPHHPQHIFVAVRGHYQVAIYKAAQQQDSAWQLGFVAAVQSQQAVRDVAWSPFDPCQAAFMCQGGSLHTLQVAEHPDAAGRLNVQAHTVVQGGHPALSPAGGSSSSSSSSRLSCQWTHPAKLACTAGRNLVQCQLAGTGKPARLVLLHSRPEGDEFLALVTPSQGPGAATSSFLAASTMHHVLLFDSRHFNAPVLTWAHGMVSEPPKLLQLALSAGTPGDHEQRQAHSQQNRSSSPLASWQQVGMAGTSPAGISSQHMASQADANYPRSLPSQDPFLLGDPPLGARGGSQAWPATQASQASDPFLAETHHPLSQGHPGQTCGAILASSLALGECKAFRFVVKPSGQCITALPPEELGKKKPNRGPIRFRKRENWGLIQVKDEEAQAVDAGRFAWRPRIGDALQSWNLPRTVCQPLKHMSDVSKGPALLDLASAHGQDAEENILQYPDLQGVTLLPIDNLVEEEDQSQRPDVLLARASFVGDLFLDPCFLFTPAHVPDREQKPPQQIAVRSTSADAADRQAKWQAERQVNGQAERHNAEAAGIVRPTARRQTGEARLKAMGVAAGQSNTTGVQADRLIVRQDRKAKAACERQELLGAEGVQDPPKPTPAECGATPNSNSMLRNLDIRQSISSRATLKKIRHANPRWKTHKYEVMFEQKGLFQADVSIHHALCAAALQNYHTSFQRLQTGGPSDPFRGPAMPESASQAQLGHSELPGNEWGFERESERVAAAQEGLAGELEAEAECPVVRLPQLQGATTVDEVEARMRWETANADGRNAAFDPAVPGPRFKAPDKAAAVARALPLVAAAYRSLTEKASSSSSSSSSSCAEQAASFLTFTAADLAPAVAAACQHAEHAMEEDCLDAAGAKLEYGGDRMISLASWTGAGLGPMTRAAGKGPGSSRAPEAPLPLDSQASVHQASQDMTGDTPRGILVPADRVVGAGQLACPVMPAQAWCGAPLLPHTQIPLLSLNNYCSVVGPGQERDDIQELEDLWLSAHGHKRGPSAVYHQTAGHTDHRPSNQPQYGVAKSPLGLPAEDNSLAGTDHQGKMRRNERFDRKSVQFAMTESLSGRKRQSTARDGEEDAAAWPPVQEKDVTEQTGAASTPGMPVPQASGSKLQPKKTRSRPSFVEGF